MTIPDKMKAVVLMGKNQLEVKEMPTPRHATVSYKNHRAHETVLVI